MGWFSGNNNSKPPADNRKQTDRKPDKKRCSTRVGTDPRDQCTREPGHRAQCWWTY